MAPASNNNDNTAGTRSNIIAYHLVLIGLVAEGGVDPYLGMLKQTAHVETNDLIQQNQTTDSILLLKPSIIHWRR